MLASNKINIDFLAGFTEHQTEQLHKALEIISPFRDKPSPRPSGFEVANILFEFNVDLETVLAALLSDPVFADHIDYDLIETQFSHVVAELVKDVIWLNTLQVYSLEITHQPSQAEILRRMLLSMTHDVRAVLVKLAYRVQRLRNLPREDDKMACFIAQETLDIYAPIANRLGIAQLKWELEDLSFRHLEPSSYRHIDDSLADNRQQREACISGFIALLQKLLTEQKLKAEIAGRTKHLYSIWRKMQRKKLNIEQLFDLLAIRIITDQVAACYAILGIIHGQWQYIPKEFDDYIANPKENGYQSLHTVILDPEGNRIEIQIRTRQMHDFAELGVAAHWRYKEGSKQNKATEKSIATLRKLLDEKDNDEALVENFRSQLFYDRIYVLTPAGKLLDLIKGSTPLDFAYAVHTEVGHRCRGAKVNGCIVPLTYTLQSGEQIEILTTKEGEPNRNWLDTNLGYLKSPRSISKVKSWFKHQQHEINLATGKQILDKESHRLGVETLDLKALCKQFNYNNEENLFAAIGRGDVTLKQIASTVHVPEINRPAPKISTKATDDNSPVAVAGIDNIVTHFAQCCSPIPGENIIGFVSNYKGITIHNRDCKNIKKLDPQQKHRLIDVSWGKKSPTILVSIDISAYNKQGLINDVTQILNAEKIDINSARFSTEDDLSATLKLDILLQDTTELSLILRKISHLPNIINAEQIV